MSPIEIGNLIVNLLKVDPSPAADKIARQIAWANRVRADHDLLKTMLIGVAELAAVGTNKSADVGSEDRPVADSFRSSAASEDPDSSTNYSGSLDDLSRDEIAKGEG